MKKVEDDEDISMEFSDEEEVNEDSEDNLDADTAAFTPHNIQDSKLFEELKRLGFNSLGSLQDGLRRAEENYFRLSGQAAYNFIYKCNWFLFTGCSWCRIVWSGNKKKRRLRLIKSSADARERQKPKRPPKMPANKPKPKLSNGNVWTIWTLGGPNFTAKTRNYRQTDWKQKQRADRKGAAQGSRFRSVIALGGSNDDEKRAAQMLPLIPLVSPIQALTMVSAWMTMIGSSTAKYPVTMMMTPISTIKNLFPNRNFTWRKRSSRVHAGASRRTVRFTYPFGSTSVWRWSRNGNWSVLNPCQFWADARCTEGLFQPLGIQGIDQTGVIEILSNIFAAYPRDTLKTLVNNLYVSGGCARIPGLKERLVNEINTILPEDLVPELNIKLIQDLEAHGKESKHAHHPRVRSSSIGLPGINTRRIASHVQWRQ